MAKVDAQGKSEKIGSITIEGTEHGLLLHAGLESLPGGYARAFHVHHSMAAVDPAHKKRENVCGGVSVAGTSILTEIRKHSGPVWGRAVWVILPA